MNAGIELDTLIAEKIPYHMTDKGKKKRREYYLKTKDKWAEAKRTKRVNYAKDNPEKIRCRNLLGNAVRRGFIEKPSGRNWHNRWEFHHPDYSRPYYGVWLTTPEHRLVDIGKQTCPTCTDYAPKVMEYLLKEWGLNATK